MKPRQIARKIKTCTAAKRLGAEPRDADCFVFAGTASTHPVVRIIAVVPHFGYARSDKRAWLSPVDHREHGGRGDAGHWDRPHRRPRPSCTPDRRIFRMPVDNLTAAPTLGHALREWPPQDVVVVSPDEGRVRMAAEYAVRLGAPVAVLHKQRESGAVTRVIKVVTRCAVVPA